MRAHPNPNFIPQVPVLPVTPQVLCRTPSTSPAVPDFQPEPVPDHFAIGTQNFHIPHAKFKTKAEPRPVTQSPETLNSQNQNASVMSLFVFLLGPDIGNTLVNAATYAPLLIGLYAGVKMAAQKTVPIERDKRLIASQQAHIPFSFGDIAPQVLLAAGALSAGAGTLAGVSLPELFTSIFYGKAVEDPVYLATASLAFGAAASVLQFKSFFYYLWLVVCQDHTALDKLKSTSTAVRVGQGLDKLLTSARLLLKDRKPPEFSDDYLTLCKEFMQRGKIVFIAARQELFTKLLQEHPAEAALLTEKLLLLVQDETRSVQNRVVILGIFKQLLSSVRGLDPTPILRQTLFLTADPDPSLRAAALELHKTFLIQMTAPAKRLDLLRDLYFPALRWEHTTQTSLSKKSWQSGFWQAAQAQITYITGRLRPAWFKRKQQQAEDLAKLLTQACYGLPQVEVEEVFQVIYSYLPQLKNDAQFQSLIINTLPSQLYESIDWDHLKRQGLDGVTPFPGPRVLATLAPNQRWQELVEHMKRLPPYAEVAGLYDSFVKALAELDPDSQLLAMARFADWAASREHRDYNFGAMLAALKDAMQPNSNGLRREIDHDTGELKAHGQFLRFATESLQSLGYFDLKLFDPEFILTNAFLKMLTDAPEAAEHYLLRTITAAEQAHSQGEPSGDEFFSHLAHLQQSAAFREFRIHRPAISLRLRPQPANRPPLVETADSTAASKPRSPQGNIA